MDEYKSLKELYQALIPALNVKLRTLKAYGIDDMKREDIWEYLKVTRWKIATNLSISEMVNDIINVSNIELGQYNRKKKDKVYNA